MNEIHINQVEPNGFFAEDSYILGHLLFFPKNTKVKEHYIDLLRTWQIDSVTTEGDFVVPSKEPEKEEVSDLESVDDLEVANSIDKDLSYKDLYKRWVLLIASFFNMILVKKDLNKQSVINFVNDVESFILRDKDSLLLIMGHDVAGLPRIYRQSLDTVIFAFIMAHGLKLPDFSKTNLILGTLFHDIGMLKIPAAIMNKKEALTPDEKKIIQGHTILGFNYIREAKYSAVIASGALQHHERIDGNGYPDRKTNEQITNIGKTVAIIDTYCAAISSKSFRNPVHAKEAIQDLLKLSGSAYDPVLLKEFVKNLSIYPLGSMVLLSNNLPARVVGNSGVAMRPVVLTLADGVEEKIDLSKRIDIYIKGVYSGK